MLPVERILGFKPEYKGSFVSNRWVVRDRPSGQWESTSPANIEWHLPHVQFSFDDVLESVSAGRRAFKAWSRLSLADRASTLMRFHDALLKRQELIARFLSLETGKPLSEALAETDLLLSKIKFTLDHGPALTQEKRFDLGIQGKAEVLYRPKGLFAVLGPFNLALSLPHGHLIPALLYGNTCIFKPSERAPYSAQIYMEAALEAEFPEGVFQMIQGNAEMGMRLVRDTDVDAVFANCTFDTGSKISRECAERPQKLLSLHLGAKNGALVWDPADLEATSEMIVRSAFMTSGQRCTALSRVYVKADLLGGLLTRVHEIAKSLVVSHPFEEEPRPFMGPLISAAAKERFFRYSAIAESEGSEIVMRAKALEGKSRLLRQPLPIGHYVTPSIHLVPKWDPKSAYQTHEIFGPDVFFAPVDSIEEGVEALNATPYGLAASFFGSKESDFDEVASKLDFGLVYFNRGTVGSLSRLPFGGWKKSGNARPSGIFSAWAATQVQTRVKT